MKTVIYRGFHSIEFQNLFNQCWDNESLLIAAPPYLEEIGFFTDKLPKGTIELVGNWEQELSFPEPTGEFSKFPQLGVFTTGTTRDKPNLVLFTKENIESSIRGILSFFENIQIDSIYCYPQPYHIFGLSLGYALSKLMGLELVYTTGVYRRDSHKSWCQASRHRDNLITMGTPTHFKDLTNYIEESGDAFHETKSSIAGGAKVSLASWDLMKNKLKIEFPSTGYGCTEAAPGVSHTSPGIRPKGDSDIGFPLPEVQLNPISGEGLEFSGPNLCLAIINENSISFPKRFTIPDQIDVEEDGSLKYIRRINLVLNRGGEKFSIEDIENRIREKFGIEVVGFSCPDTRLGEDLALAFLKSELDQSTKISDIYSFLEVQFGRSFNSKNNLLLDEIPVNHNSKFDRKACAKKLSERQHGL